MTGVLSAFIASACVVTTDDPDDSTAGAAGSGTAGSGTAGGGKAGAGTAGAGTAGAATAGSGGAGAEPFQCDPGEGGAQGTPNTCAPGDPNDECQKCVQTKCCTEYALCYATDPGNQCGWGGPKTIDGQPNEGGELACVQICLQKAVEESGTAPSDTDVGTCANQCATTPANGGTKDCGVIGIQTSDAVACLRENCSLKCFGAE